MGGRRVVSGLPRWLLIPRTPGVLARLLTRVSRSSRSVMDAVNAPLPSGRSLILLMGVCSRISLPAAMPSFATERPLGVCGRIARLTLPGSAAARSPASSS